jgi:hypothetical protein
MNEKLFNLSYISNKSKPLMDFFKSLKNINITSDELIKEIKKNLKEEDYLGFLKYFEEFIKEFGFRGISEIDCTRDR